MHERKGFTLPAARRTRPRDYAVSLAAHGLLVLGLLGAYRGFVTTRADAAAVVLAHPMALPLGGYAPAPAPAPPPAARGAQPMVPATTPAAVSPPPPAPLVAETPGVPEGLPGGIAAGVAGARGLSGIGPTTGDRRLFVRPLYIPADGSRPIEMDSVIRGRLLAMAAMADSLARDSFGLNANPYTQPWVFESGGRKWGIDQNSIHLGFFSIPTAVLALLPMPEEAMGNYDQSRANARLMQMRAEILRAAARSEAEDEFRRSVERIRARKERERQEARQREDRDRPRDVRP